MDDQDKGRYDPDIHHRHSIRLPGWDYQSPAAYFVTICTYERALLFDDPRFRSLAESLWQNIPAHASGQHVQLDAWVVMPNHVHGILILANQAPVGARQPGDAHPAASHPPIPVVAPETRRKATAGSLGAIIGSYKSQVTRRINGCRHTPAALVWQRGFYEHIVRSLDELDRIRVYIRDNPSRWAAGRDGLESLVERMQGHVDDDAHRRG